MLEPSQPAASKAGEGREHAEFYQLPGTHARHQLGGFRESIRNAFESCLVNPAAVQKRFAPSVHLQKLPDKMVPVTWDDLTPGVRWVILKMLCENDIPSNPRGTPNPFSIVVSVKLRLTHLQIQNFLCEYVYSYALWKTWEDQAQKINWSVLMEAAAEQNTSVIDFLPKGRPKLSTDVMAKEATEHGAAFLRGRGLDDFADRMSDWIGINTFGNFLSVRVEIELLADYLDDRAIRKAISLGWINPQRTAGNVCNKRAAEGLPPVPGGVYRNSVQNVFLPGGHFEAERLELLGNKEVQRNVARQQALRAREQAQVQAQRNRQRNGSNGNSNGVANAPVRPQDEKLEQLRPAADAEKVDVQQGLLRSVFQPYNNNTMVPWAFSLPHGQRRMMRFNGPQPAPTESEQQANHSSSVFRPLPPPGV